jgi:hypothetical protein
MSALKGGSVGSVDMAEALAMPKRVNVAGDAVQTAREMGISFGS